MPSPLDFTMGRKDLMNPQSPEHLLWGGAVAANQCGGLRQGQRGAEYPGRTPSRSKTLPAESAHRDPRQRCRCGRGEALPGEGQGEAHSAAQRPGGQGPGGAGGELGAGLSMLGTFPAVGIDELSVSPSSMPPLRAEIRKSIAKTRTLKKLECRAWESSTSMRCPAKASCNSKV